MYSNTELLELVIDYYINLLYNLKELFKVDLSDFNIRMVFIFLSSFLFDFLR